MRILFILPYAPLPVDSGNKNLTHAILNSIGKQAKFDIISLIPKCSPTLLNSLNSQHFEGLGKITFFNKPLGLLKFIYKLFFLLNLRHPSFGSNFNYQLNKFFSDPKNFDNYDLVHFDMFHMIPYRWSLKANIPTVLVASDAYSLAAFQTIPYAHGIKNKIMAFLDFFLLKNMERRDYKLFTNVCTVGDRDFNYLSKISKNIALNIIGIGLNHIFFHSRIIHHDFMNDTPNILISGSLDHPIISDNIIEYLKILLPSIENKNITINIVGKNPTDILLSYIKLNKKIIHIEYVENYFKFLDND